MSSWNVCLSAPPKSFENVRNVLCLFSVGTSYQLDIKPGIAKVCFLLQRKMNKPGRCLTIYNSHIFRLDGFRSWIINFYIYERAKYLNISFLENAKITITITTITKMVKRLRRIPTTIDRNTQAHTQQYWCFLSTSVKLPSAHRPH